MSVKTFQTGGVYPAPEHLPISSPYGWRIIDGEREFHAGIDITGQGEHHPVYATMASEVIVNQWSDTGGWMIYLRHLGDDYYSRYLHLHEQSPIPVGRLVLQGQQIGKMGSTGLSYGIHLHFEVAYENANWGTERGTIDPQIYLGLETDPGQPDPGQPGQPGVGLPIYLNRHSTNMRRMGVRGRR